MVGAGLFVAGGKQVSASRAAKGALEKIAGLPLIETSDNTILFFKDWGEGKPVLFVHSWALNSDMWQYQMNYLASRNLRCIAYDRRGHGRSSQPGRGYDYNTLADDLALLMEQLDLSDVALVSHSMGAGEIIRYLSRHGARRISRIVLVSPTTPFLLKTEDNPNGVDRSRFDAMRTSLSKDSPHWFAAGVPGFFGAGLPGVSVSPEMIQWGLNLCLSTSLKALMECNLAMIETDFRSEMRKVFLPALIIHGDADQSVPLALTGQKSAELIAGSQFKVYEGAPHGLLFTHMERLNKDLLSFITG